MPDNKTPDFGQFMSSGTPMNPSEVPEPSEKENFNYMNAMQSMFRAMNQGEQVQEDLPEAAPQQPVTATPKTLSSEQVETAPAQTPAEEVTGDGKDEAYWSYVDSILDHFDDGKKATGESYPKSEAFPQQSAAPAAGTIEDQPAVETPQPPVEPNPIPYGTPAERAYAARQERIRQQQMVQERIAARQAAQQVMQQAQPQNTMYPAAPQYFTQAAQNQVQQPAAENKQPQADKAVTQPAASAAEVDAALAAFDEGTPARQSRRQAPPRGQELPQEPSEADSQTKEKNRKKQNKKQGKKSKNSKKGKNSKKKGSILPKKGDSAFEVVRKLVVIVSAISLILCAIYFGYTIKERYDNTHVNKNAQAAVDTEYTDEEVEAKWKEIKAKYPDVNFPEGMQVKFATLYAQNQDLVGWITIEGLGIDYPVMQNSDYYLKHNFSKTYSAYGAPYLDQYNKVYPLDDNSTIYAHSMRRDDQMFTNLKEYKSIDGFKKNPIIEYDTLYANYKFKVYAVFITNGTASGDNGYLFNYPTSNFVSDEAFVGYVEQLNQRALYTTGVDIEVGDKLITLSTCTYDFTEARLVVVGRMVRDGEDETVDTSLAVKNSNPRYPQAYYDAKGLSNPYKNAEKWYNQDT